MFDVVGRMEKRSPFRLPEPPVGRVHPKDSSFLSRKGKAVKDVDGRIIGRDGECIRKAAFTTRSSRSKLATAASSSIQQRFVCTNHGVDRLIDCPVNLVIEAATAAPYRQGVCRETRKRFGLSRMRA